MSYYITNSPSFQRKNMNNGKIPEQHRTQVLFGDFSTLKTSHFRHLIANFGGHYILVHFFKFHLQKN